MPVMAAPAMAAPAMAARPMMGGQVSVHIVDDVDPRTLELAAARVLDRIEAWALRLTRFLPESELCRLNASGLPLVPIGPTLAAVLGWARTAESISDGLVDVAMLDARLAAEDGLSITRPLAAARRWSMERGARGAALRREPGVRLDLDGVAKGWLADRALAITPGRSVLVDGDGDLAARVAPGDELDIGVADPRTPDVNLAVIRLAGDAQGAPRRLGLATSGTSVHRWTHGADAGHHLIDPLTWRPAVTDIVQATVLAGSAREAETLAKVAVIAGSERAPILLDRPGVHGVLMLTTRGEIRATPGMLRWLA